MLGKRALDNHHAKPPSKSQSQHTNSRYEQSKYNTTHTLKRYRCRRVLQKHEWENQQGQRCTFTHTKCARVHGDLEPKCN
eukprot:m.15443 g.15443  ORF g.15443 m.15443 type:complete len:80 (+) comp6613_c0_seq1:205-444(+)